MKRRIFSVLTASILLASLGGCSASPKAEDISALDPCELTVSQTANADTLSGFGVEWDPHLFRSFNSRNIDDSDWELIKTRFKELGVQKIRVMVLPGWIEPVNDNSDPAVTDLSAFTFDSEAFKSLLRELDFAEECGITVNLTIWGAELSSSPWLAYPDCGDWLSAPNNPQEFAENASVLFKYLLDTKGYTCVKELTIHNEPNWAFKDNGGSVSFDYYAEVCAATDARFKADGLRDRVRFILSDDSMDFTWFQSSVDRLKSVADGYNSHNYSYDNSAGTFELSTFTLNRTQYIKDSDPGKPFSINEFGTNAIIDAYHQSNTDTYERGLYYARLAANSLNSGASGMLHWEFFDMYYYDGPRENALMQLGLFKYKDEGWAVRPMYQAWGLIMKHTRAGSKIYPVTSDNESVCGAALLSPEGKWTVIAASSGAGGDTGVMVTLPAGVSGSFKKYLYSKATLSSSDKLPDPVAELPASSTISFSVPDESFVILTNLYE